MKCNEHASITGAINWSWCKHVYISILPRKYLRKFLGVGTELQKATNTFVMSVYMFFRIQLGSYWTDFHKIWYWSIFFRNVVGKIQVWFKYDNNNEYFTWRTIHIFWSHLAQFFVEWEMFQTKVVEKIKTNILCSVTFFRKSYRLWDNVRARQVTDDNIMQRLRIACRITKSTNTHTMRICDICCFSTAAMVAGTCLDATL